MAKSSSEWTSLSRKEYQRELEASRKQKQNGQATHERIKNHAQLLPARPQEEPTYLIE